MSNKPVAELSIDEPRVRALVVEQAIAVIPDAMSRPLAHAADGWDCSVWRLGDDLAVRLPRRELAAPLILHERAVLGDVAARLVHTGIGVPAPIFSGRPSQDYPWPWSIVPWFDGTAGLNIPLRQRRGWAAPLAGALSALHTRAPNDHPVSAVRGVPLAQRDAAVTARLRSLRGRTEPGALATAEMLWRSALDAVVWPGPPVWIHGDLHPGNLIARESTLIAIIDFGDVTAGDPAYDLAVAWLAFDLAGRSAFVAAIAGRYDDATWTRGRGWAAAVTLLLLDQSDDDPDYARLGSDALEQLLI